MIDSPDNPLHEAFISFLIDGRDFTKVLAHILNGTHE
jgi:hypothetical protein